MNMQELMMVWSDSAPLSLAIWMVLVVFIGYLGRGPAHGLLYSTSRMIYGSMRLWARSLNLMERRLSLRNKEVILSHGKEHLEQAIEREFQRVNTVLERDLADYPALHRQISDEIKRIGEDYRNSAEGGELAPSWLAAIETINAIPRNGDATMSKILDNIQETIETAHRETMNEYIKVSQARHKILKEMSPSWRKLEQTLGQVKTSVDGLAERSKSIDEQMASYEQIRNGEDGAARMLTSSSLTQFFVAGLVLVVAVLGAVINFQLIALPMSEMVGGTSQLGSLRTADVAALVIIMVEIAMGLFLMESLRITRLFPIISAMDDKMRKRMTVITFTILFILASVEASLAYMRDLLAMDREAITQSLSGLGVVEAQFRWIPSLGQMVMGFILPFTLAFVAIPLESFVHALRTVIGLSASALLRTMAAVVRFVGYVALQSGRVAVSLYDLIILLPLGIEQIVADRKARKEEAVVEETEEPVLFKEEKLS